MEEGEKRKTDNDDDVSGSRKKARAKEGTVVDVQTPPLDVADAEVEEFFAILKRLRTAVKYFGQDDGESGSGRKMTQAVERECLTELNGVTGEKNEAKINKMRVIDLNMDPNPDDNSS